ncbi:hypothetical protein CVD28_02845 [Bacillus sp. M6-12]|uniref:hypothetical protein n=1 Tax=Bacillus sp. M6-12 TaxID=2054166 RepID=UPI000C78B59B|nr:hypothetical protein [Bacillus sp. M6-12]PLS19369.1 hypothetical protein CVD28_02845 [Bacillus sp. M6-12]
MLKKGLVVEFEVLVKYPQFVSVGSLVEYQDTEIEIKKIETVVPQEGKVLVIGTGKVLKDKKAKNNGHACDDCNGSGGDMRRACSTCKGSGWMKE